MGDRIDTPKCRSVLARDSPPRAPVGPHPIKVPFTPHSPFQLPHRKKLREISPQHL
jgi:hypothetical protein